MSLTLSTGPFGPKRRGDFNFDTSVLKPHTLYFEDTPKRVRAVFAGETIADSRRARLLFETAIMPVHYFPEEDVRMDLLTATDHTTHCPFKGDANYWTIKAGGAEAENAAWAYPHPKPESAWLDGYIALYFEKMDHFFEEDEEILGHPATRTIAWTFCEAHGKSKSSRMARPSPRRTVRWRSSRRVSRRVITSRPRT